jgi:5'-phosphate synthase pdxT subunit
MGRVGILALQGGFALLRAASVRIGLDAIEVRAAEQLRGLSGLILPGGESSVQLRLLESSGLWPEIVRFVESGRPILATCAGLILAARAVVGPAQRSFGFLDIEVKRNGWGRQVDSFEAESDEGVRLVFIRAPRIIGTGRAVEVLARYAGEPVLVRQGRVFGASFHPELVGDGLHRKVFASPERFQ